MTYYGFDIETEAGNEETIRDLCKPFVKPPPPGEFNQAAVKLGRMKDQVKIDAKIQESRDAHEELVANYAEKCIADERDYWRKIIDNAAKNPALGKIVVIGVLNANSKEPRYIDGDEPDILSSWWAAWEARMGEGAVFVGCNNFEFDLPFLRIRSWVNNVPVPGAVRESRWWHRCFVDVRQEWLSGRRYTDCESNLNHIGKALGLGGKLPGDIASQFGRYWREQREVAQNYLRRDLELTLQIAGRLGIIREKAA